MQTTASEQRYDRQLRLWDSHGQAALQNAKVCLINATATGSEILKNLVLPGIGSYTIIDDSNIRPEDAGCNFFTPQYSVGKSRGAVVTEMLLELNNDVNGDYIAEDLVTLIDNKPEFFEAFTLVIATSLSLKEIKSLSLLLTKYKKPFLLAQSYGMIGYLRVVAPHHTIVESHPENAHFDLRLDCPFPALNSFVDSINLESLEDSKHRLVPYGVLLLHYLKEWMREYNALPKSYADKKLFKAYIESDRRKSTDPSFVEDNYDEAIRNASKVFVPTTISNTVSELMNRQEVENINRNSDTFWIKLKAIKQFVENEGCGLLPLQGTIPDMEADSASYTQLQKIYSTKAEEDIKHVWAHVNTSVRALDLPHDLITENDVRRFCKNARNLRMVNCRSIAEEMDPNSLLMLNGNDGDGDTRALNYYIVLRAVRLFHDNLQHYPGHREEEIDTDMMSLRQQVNTVTADLKLNHRVDDEILHEICRYAACELHSIAAVVGGLGSQESIKLITGQFVPIENTLIYDGLDNKCTTLCT
eukprot:CFRG6347T1